MFVFLLLDCVSLSGAGVYFAESASYSASPRYAKMDGQGNQFMFLAMMTVGEVHIGDGGIATPPEGTDTLVDTESGTQIYVMQHDHQAYPLYVLKFSTRNNS